MLEEGLLGEVVESLFPFLFLLGIWDPFSHFLISNPKVSCLIPHCPNFLYCVRGRYATYSRDEREMGKRKRKGNRTLVNTKGKKDDGCGYF